MFCVAAVYGTLIKIRNLSEVLALFPMLGTALEYKVQAFVDHCIAGKNENETKQTACAYGDAITEGAIKWAILLPSAHLAFKMAA